MSCRAPQRSLYISVRSSIIPLNSKEYWSNFFRCMGYNKHLISWISLVKLIGPSPLPASPFLNKGTKTVYSTPGAASPVTCTIVIIRRFVSSNPLAFKAKMPTAFQTTNCTRLCLSAIHAQEYADLSVLHSSAIFLPVHWSLIWHLVKWLLKIHIHHIYRVCLYQFCLLHYQRTVTNLLNMIYLSWIILTWFNCI